MIEKKFEKKFEKNDKISSKTQSQYQAAQSTIFFKDTIFFLMN